MLLLLSNLLAPGYSYFNISILGLLGCFIALLFTVMMALNSQDGCTPSQMGNVVVALLLARYRHLLITHLLWVYQSLIMFLVLKGI